MANGLTFEIDGKKFFVDPEERLAAGQAPVLVVSGATTKVDKFLSTLPPQVVYKNGSVVPIRPIKVFSERAVKRAINTCRTARSDGFMVVIGLDAASSELWDPFQRWALWSFGL